jgi:hypothetical protein
MSMLIDRPPAGWFALAVMKAGSGRKWDWCALMIDVHPDELKHCLQDGVSLRRSGRIPARWKPHSA